MGWVVGILVVSQVFTWLGLIQQGVQIDALRSRRSIR